MIKPILFSLLLPCAAFGQGYADLGGSLKAIGDASSDVARDSASALVKQRLGAILESDSAWTASFKGVPISHVEPTDGAFRLFTWNVRQADGSFRYEGFLLVRHKHGQDLVELRDMTGHITSPAIVQLSAENWYGALYYEVIPVKRGGRTWYTLLGWKGVSDLETQKVVEVLSFAPTAKFGAAAFPDGRKRNMRKLFAYSAQGKMTLKWDAAHLSIVADHLAPTDPAFAGNPAFMAPDMTYDAYFWDKDHWEMQRDVDVRGTDKQKPFKAPKPEP
ncbi:MAG: hypothetical protein ACOH13_06530 [Flavobacteriales bacterium]